MELLRSMCEEDVGWGASRNGTAWRRLAAPRGANVILEDDLGETIAQIHFFRIK
jgi:hypothetical protein